MKPRVFQQTGSRVYRGRFRIGDDLKIHDVPLKTSVKHVAEAKPRQLVREIEEERAGLLPPKPLREAACRPLAEHLRDYVGDVTARSRSKKHIALVRNRIGRLCAECGWNRIADLRLTRSTSGARDRPMQRKR